MFARIVTSVRYRLNTQVLRFKKFVRRRALTSKDFTIISNNCWGSFVSQHYGLPYNSPTCGLLILGEDYVKFCGNLKFYVAQRLEFIPFKEGRFYKLLDGCKPFPVAKLGDIEVYFMHYKTPEEAAEKWYRRCKRINWNKIVFKLSHRASSTNEIVEAFAALNLPNKLIFAEKSFGESTILVPGITTIDGDETPLTFEAFNLTKFLNSLK